jgi:8-oxo-dGTP diphosphatase
MKRFLLRIWRILPIWMQRLASTLLRPRYLVAVALMIFNKQGQLLLCKHTYRRQHPWGLPGGGLKPGEDPLLAARRELFEETGFTIQDARLALADNASEFHNVSLTYLCTGLSGTFVPSDEVSDIAYFDTDKLPGFFPEHQRTITRALAILKSEAAQKPSIF